MQLKKSDAITPVLFLGNVVLCKRMHYLSSVVRIKEFVEKMDNGTMKKTRFLISCLFFVSFLAHALLPVKR